MQFPLPPKSLPELASVRLIRAPNKGKTWVVNMTSSPVVAVFFALKVETLNPKQQINAVTSCAAASGRSAKQAIWVFGVAQNSESLFKLGSL